MIYCVAFRDVEAYLAALGYKPIDQTPNTVVFARGLDVLTVRKPNLRGGVPEILINDAFDAADIPPPKWDLFWCD